MALFPGVAAQRVGERGESLDVAAPAADARHVVVRGQRCRARARMRPRRRRSRRSPSTSKRHRGARARGRRCPSRPRRRDQRGDGACGVATVGRHPVPDVEVRRAGHHAMRPRGARRRAAGREACGARVPLRRARPDASPGASIAASCTTARRSAPPPSAGAAFTTVPHGCSPKAGLNMRVPGAGGAASAWRRRSAP